MEDSNQSSFHDHHELDLGHPDVDWSSSQTLPLLIYCLIATLLGLVGNVVVIYASVRYNAIKLDEVSLLLVQVGCC